MHLFPCLCMCACMCACTPKQKPMANKTTQFTCWRLHHREASPPSERSGSAMDLRRCCSWPALSDRRAFWLPTNETRDQYETQRAQTNDRTDQTPRAVPKRNPHKRLSEIWSAVLPNCANYDEVHPRKLQSTHELKRYNLLFDVAMSMKMLVRRYSGRHSICRSAGEMSLFLLLEKC